MLSRLPESGARPRRRPGSALASGAMHVAAIALAVHLTKQGLESRPVDNQFELIRELSERGVLDRDVAALFHRIRLAGNDAAHGFTGAPGDAVHLLKLARELGVWFHRTFGDPAFCTGPLSGLT